MARSFHRFRLIIASILGTVFLAAGLMIAIAPSVYAAESYDLWIAGAQVTSDNAADVFGDGAVRYDADAKTLTLDGYDSGANPVWTSYSGNFCTLRSGIEGLTVNVVGDTTIRGAGASCTSYSEYA